MSAGSLRALESAPRRGGGPASVLTTARVYGRFSRRALTLLAPSPLITGVLTATSPASQAADSLPLPHLPVGRHTLRGGAHHLWTGALAYPPRPSTRSTAGNNPVRAGDLLGHRPDAVVSSSQPLLPRHRHPRPAQAERHHRRQQYGQAGDQRLGLHPEQLLPPTPSTRPRTVRTWSRSTPDRRPTSATDPHSAWIKQSTTSAS